MSDSLLRGSSILANSGALLPIGGVDLAVALFKLSDLCIAALHSGNTIAVSIHATLPSSSSRLKRVIVGSMTSLLLGFDLLIEGCIATIILLLSYNLSVSNAPTHTTHTEMREDFIIEMYIHYISRKLSKSRLNIHRLGCLLSEGSSKGLPT
nr:MAG TPA: hypothetical protein [Caudoviricetes sp.]